MIDQQTIQFKAFKLVSYVSFVIVLAGLTTVFVLALYNSCDQLDFAGVVCVDPTNQMLGQIGMTIIWATIYTVVPAILALAGAYFGVARLMKMERDRLSSKKA